MNEPAPESREGRLDNLAPGVPVQAKIALLLGLAGGLFLAIILSYTDADRQLLGLGAGLGLGIAAAIALTILDWRKHRSER